MRVPLIAVLAVAAATAGCSSGRPAAPPIQVSVSHCGQGWRHPHAGQQTLQISNTGDTPAEAYVVELSGGRVYGDFDGQINGRPDGLPRSVADPGFTGFHRVEYGLWHGELAAALKGPAAKLAAAVRGLRADFPKEQVDPADLGLRAHEILEGT